MRKPIPNNRRRSPKTGPDYFPTPPWATRALCRKLSPMFDLGRSSVWEPACGGGHMARPLGEYFGEVRATDLHDYRAEFPDCQPGHDFGKPSPDIFNELDWIITNPPFLLAEMFLAQAMARARIGFALFVKVQFLEGIGRYKTIYGATPPTAIFQFAERVPLVTNRLDPDARTNQSYIWCVWLKNADDRRALRASVAGPVFGWIPPSRPSLERVEDYPARPADQGSVIEDYIA